jgi:hypothetical protein
VTCRNPENQVADQMNEVLPSCEPLQQLVAVKGMLSRLWNGVVDGSQQDRRGQCFEARMLAQLLHVGPAAEHNRTIAVFEQAGPGEFKDVLYHLVRLPPAVSLATAQDTPAYEIVELGHVEGKCPKCLTFHESSAQV